MAQVLNLSPLSSSTRPESNGLRLYNTIRTDNGKLTWFNLQRQIQCNGKFTCLFTGNSDREEQARRALDSALGGKKDEFERWNKEIKKREEAGGGGESGGGGWFGGWGRRFGWSNGDNFWPEVKQIFLALLGIVAIYLVVAKGELLLAVIINPWLHVLRGTRNGLTFISSKILGKTSPDSPADFTDRSKEGTYVLASAKQRVVRKWGSD